MAEPASRLTLPQSREASHLDRIPLSIVDDIFAAVARPAHHSVPEYDCCDEQARPLRPSARPLTLVAKRFTRSGRRAMFLRLRLPSQIGRVAKLLLLLRRRPELSTYVRRIDLPDEFWSADGTTDRQFMRRAVFTVLTQVFRGATGLRALTMGRRSSLAFMIGVLELLATHKAVDRLEMLGLSMFESVGGDDESEGGGDESEGGGDGSAGEGGGDRANATSALLAFVEQLQPAELRWDTNGDALLDAEVMDSWPIAAGQRIVISGPVDSNWIDEVPDEWIEVITGVALGRGADYYSLGAFVPDLSDFKCLRRLDIGGLEFSRARLEALPPTLEALEIAHPGEVKDNTFYPGGELDSLVKCLASSTWCPALNELVVDLGSLREYIRDEFEPWHRHEALYSVHVNDPKVLATVDALRQHTERRGVHFVYTPPPKWDPALGDQDDYLGELYDRYA